MFWRLKIIQSPEFWHLYSILRLVFWHVQVAVQTTYLIYLRDMSTQCMPWMLSDFQVHPAYLGRHLYIWYDNVLREKRFTPGSGREKKSPSTSVKPCNGQNKKAKKNLNFAGIFFKVTHFREDLKSRNENIISFRDGFIFTNLASSQN